MNEEMVDSSVNAFRAFINKHPELRKELRKSGRSWQEYYEKWILLGENDPYWNDMKLGDGNETSENHEQEDMMERLIKLTDKIDVKKVEHQVQQLNKTIQIVQSFFTSNIREHDEETEERQSRDVFKLFRD